MTDIQDDDAGPVHVVERTSAVGRKLADRVIAYGVDGRHRVSPKPILIQRVKGLKDTTTLVPLP